MYNNFYTNQNFSNMSNTDINMISKAYSPYADIYKHVTSINSNYYNQLIPSVYEKYNLKKNTAHYSRTENEMKDHGPEPYTVNIEEITSNNKNFRTVLWTGEHMQLTLMSINPGEEIGLEMHPKIDQFIRIEEGQGIVKMGENKDKLNYQEDVFDDFAFIIPAGYWHNIINTGTKDLKLYSIYAPPQHPHGTIHETKEDAMAKNSNQ